MKYTRKKVDAILNDLRNGCTRKGAAEANAISRSELYLWMKRYRTFRTQVEEAEAVAERGMTEVVRRAASKGEWKAAIEWLKRRRRADWGDSIDVRKVDDDTLLRLLELAGGGSEAGIDEDGERQTPA